MLALLEAHDIQLVADVRRFPASRRLPHFNREYLEQALHAAAIGYVWIPELGGRRAARKDSVNTGWRVAAFRGYADHMETPEFGDAFRTLLHSSRDRRTAVMCAEVLWWQCHRRLIADSLLARGCAVLHIQSPKSVSPHKLMAPALLRDGTLSYAAEQLDL